MVTYDEAVGLLAGYESDRRHHERQARDPFADGARGYHARGAAWSAGALRGAAEAFGMVLGEDPDALVHDAVEAVDWGRA